MQLLHAIRKLRRGTTDADFGERLQFGIRTPGKTDYFDTQGSCHFRSVQNGGAFATGADSQKRITFPSVALDVTRKDMFITKVVRNARNMPRVTNSNGRHPRPILLISSCQLFCKVHSIAHRAAIAASKDRPFNFQRLDKALGCLLDGQQNRVVPEKPIQGFTGCNKVGSDVCDRHSMGSLDDTPD